jgi:hypothetical protein
MVRLLATIGHQRHIGVFRRFAVMHYWHNALRMPFRRIPLHERTAHERLELRLHRKAFG